jgi:hypothetical protein
MSHRPLYAPSAQLKIALTARCTNNCPICFNDTMRKDNERRVDLDADLIRRAIDDAAAMGVAGVYWTGGEPLLRYRELVDLSRFARARGLFASVVTNAGPLGADATYRAQNRALLERAGCLELEPSTMVAELAEAGLVRCFISLDNSHNTLFEGERAPDDRVPTAVAARALDSLLDAGFGHAHPVQAIGHRLRIAMTGNGPWREPSERILEDVCARVGLERSPGEPTAGEPEVRRYGSARGTVVVKILETAQVGAALILPERLLERRRGDALASIRCSNLRPRADGYDGGQHHQDISVNHDGEVALCGNFMYPIGNLREATLVELVDRVNHGPFDGPYAGTQAVLNRLFRLAEHHGFGDRAIGEAFRMLGEDAPELVAGIATEGGACNSLGRDRQLQERFIGAFDRRFGAL